MTDRSIDLSRYLAFEGVEGAGKSSVASAIAERIARSGADVVRVREPGGTPVGERVREILLSGEVHPLPRAEAALFAAARAQLVSEVVIPALETGAWVISDRSAYSSLAYQAGGRGLPLDEVFQLNDMALGGIWPSKVVLLRVGTADGLARQSDPDRIGGETEAFFDTVVGTFDALAEAEPDRFIVVDATQRLDVVISEVADGLGLA
ncbi:MAG: dTMP kinase [Acidimicrobiia bacterium]